MKRKHYSVEINAEKRKIWEVLWNDATYREWTAAFTEGSHVETDGFKEGSKVRFLDPKGSGMYSKVERNVPFEKMAFTHIGEIVDGKEKPVDEKSRKWSGAQEIYTLKENGEAVKLEVELDMDEEYAGMFDNTFPKALKKVKELSEG